MYGVLVVEYVKSSNEEYYYNHINYERSVDKVVKPLVDDF